ncbi:MAG: hypothetical protein FWG83_06530 [Oscillospiraceae bacterium]|nr:hypothetical protein [Oscillospiraceae bacterium]
MKKKLLILISVLIILFVIIPPIILFALFATVMLGPVAVGIFGGSKLVSFTAIYSVVFMPVVSVIISIFIIILISCKKLEFDIAELEQELEELEESGE